MHTKNPIVVKYFLWLLLGLLCFKGLRAQSYIADVRKLSVEDGLSNRFVNSIYKDSRGFIWIGTRYGLNRYDGYTFKRYTTENSALISDIILNTYEDTAQRLWIVQPTDLGTYITILDLKTNIIKSFDEVFKDKVPFTNKDIDYIYSNAVNDIFISTAKGDIYRYRNNRFEHIFTRPDSTLRTALYLNERYLWIQLTTQEGKEKMLKISLRDQAVEEIELPGYTETIGVDKNDALWLFQFRQKKLLCISNGKDDLKTIDLRSFDLPEAVYKNPDFREYRLNPSDSLIWWWRQQKDQKAFFVLHPREGIIYNLQPEIESSLTYETHIRNVYFDIENRAWVATQDGIFIITLKKNKFTTLLSGQPETYSVRGIIKDSRGTLHICTYNGSMQLSPEGDIIKKDKNMRWFCAAADNRGNLWFGAGDGRIEKYDPPSGKSRYYSDVVIVPRYTTSSIWAILPGKTGRIWAGTRKGLYFLDPDTGLRGKFGQNNTFSLFEKSTIYYLFEDEKGIWIATSSGLYLLEPGKGITARYAPEEKAPRHIPHSHILHFYRDKAGIFWLATRGGGLIRFNPEDGSYQQFTTAEGLSSDIIYAVYEDNYGKLWLPSNYGLMKFDKENHQVTTYLTNDGISHNEFNTISHYRGNDGRLYFGGLSGVTVVDPEDFVTDKVAAAPLHITGCHVLNSKKGELTDKTPTVLASGELQLSPSDRSFIVDFALLNYENSYQNSYTYKIEGLDKHWNTIKGNSLRINALPYGNYGLHIKGRGIGGEQSANEIRIALRVEKPFYVKNGFILSSIVALALLIYGIFRWRLQRLRQSEIRLKRIVRERTQEIQQQKDKLQELNAVQSRWFINVAHELRTPLTLILGPVRQFLKIYPGAAPKGIENIQLAEKNSRSLLHLVNEILDVSRLESNQLKLNKAPASLSRLIRQTTAHFESFAQQKGIILSSYIPDELELHIDKDRIQNILVNLISNALKFTHAGGKVTVSLDYEKDTGVMIAVTDTGDGIPEKDLPHVFERYYQASDPAQINQGGTGIGLSLSLELARLHGGDLTAESQEEKGSTFTLTLPQNLVLGVGKPVATPVAVTLPEVRADRTVQSIHNKQNKPLILLVEDNPDMRQYIRSFMDKDYRVAEAADGVEALKYLKKNRPDLIISDVMMPRMDGIILAKTLKEDENLKNLPFITLTARVGESDKIAALRIGIDDYLIKPFNPEELEIRVFNLIRNYNRRKAVSQTQPDETLPPPSHHDTLIAETKSFIIEQLQNNSLGVTDLARFHNMSPSSLNRLLKKASGLSPGQFIREIRLQQARRLLETRQYPTVLEVVYAVGFEKASYFAKRFTERFGKNPSEYL